MADDVDVAPGWRLIDLVFGAQVTQVVAAVAKLRIVDHLSDGPATTSRLADVIGADADVLRRLLCAAAAVGLLAPTGVADEYAATPVGECLRAGPGSMREFALMQAAPGQRRPYERLAEAVVTGRPVAREALGVEIWEYYRDRPEEGALFAHAMSGLSALLIRTVAPLIEVGRGEVVVDVGGGHGAMLRALLAKAADARGVLFDRPEVVSAAPVGDRLEVVGGDFLAAVPAEGSTYVLSHVLHDWDDDAATRILANCHRAARPDARLLIIETMLPEGPIESQPFLLDLNMFVLTAGRERRSEDFVRLLTETGWRSEGVTPVGGGHAVLQARRVSPGHG
jgi:SAM-dependent methyltransferase